MLAAAGLGVSELHAAAIRVISTMVSGEIRIPPEYEPRLAEAEYSEDEPHTFATLAARRQPMAKYPICPTATVTAAPGSTPCGGRWGWTASSAWCS